MQHLVDKQFDNSVTTFKPGTNPVLEKFIAEVSDPTNIRQVVFHYSLPGRQSNITTKMNDTNEKISKHGLIHKFYSASIVLPSNTKQIRFYSTLYDSKGNKILNITSPSKIMNIKPITYLSNTVNVTTDISKIDLGNRTANMKIKLEGPLINIANLTIPSARRNTGDPENINLTLIDGSPNNTPISIPASFHNVTQFIAPEVYGSFQATIGNSSKPFSVPLTGTPVATSLLSFPLDRYSVDYVIKIPFFKNVSIKNDPHYEATYNSSWDGTSPSEFQLTHPWNSQTNTTDLKIHMNITRNDYLLWTIIFPVMLVFFVLGSICLLEPEGHNLVARITITLGVFAFVFALDLIFAGLKPSPLLSGSSTFGDFLLQLVLVAAIASTISSVIGSITKNKKWNTLHTYRIYDIIAPVLVLIIGIIELIYMKRYIVDYSAWFIIIKPASYEFITIIMVGLGWGLIYNVISQYLRRKISELSKQDDLLFDTAMKIVKELQKKVDEREISKYGEYIIRETRRETRKDT